MNARLDAPRAAFAFAAALVCSACASAPASHEIEWLDGTHTRAAGPGLRVRWIRDLVPQGEGAYIPVEHAAAALDPDGGRVFVGSTRGRLWALRHDGTPLYEYDAGAGIEASPGIDARGRDVYVTTVRGDVHALEADTGRVRWKASVGAAVSEAPLLSDDAVYVVTDADGVYALARADGSMLWRYKREPYDGISIAGHAGLVRTTRGIATGFTDGTVVMLDAGDGRVVWELDTSTAFDDGDRGTFPDVDTTPAVADDALYVASFSGGAYALDVQGGGVLWHEPSLTGVTRVAVAPGTVLLASAQAGLVALERPTHAPRWVQPPESGAPGVVHVEGGIVYVAETLGDLRAFTLASGREIGRLGTGHGITGPTSMAAGQAYVLSNAGRLFALAY